MKFIYSIALLLSFQLVVGQQVTFRKESKNIPIKAQIDFSRLPEVPSGTLENLNPPVPGGNSYADFLEEVKLKMSASFPEKNTSLKSSKKTANTPTISKSMGMWMHQTTSSFFDSSYVQGGNPSDHTLAVSNDGKLMIGWNTAFWGYDLQADTVLFKPNIHFTTLSFSNIIVGSGISLNFPFDPKLCYDPQEDRFIFLFLSGRGPTDSKIVVGFSKTNNPALGWNVYEIPGNPNNNNQWTDYPAMAVNANEVFITVNLLRAGEPWETGFAETIVWQINKFDGYNGTSQLQNTLWRDIKFDNDFLRYFPPVQPGEGAVENNMYFISNRSIPQLSDTIVLLNDSIFLVEITGKQDNPATTLTVKAGKANAIYGTPPNGRQINNHRLNTNDSRVLGAFYDSGEIQFVGNTIDTATGLAAIYHGYISQLSNANILVELNIIGGDELKGERLDLGYPNITSTTNGAALIGVNHTSPANFAGHSCFYVAPSGDYSPQLILKEGRDYVDRIPGLSERWGDYSGVQRKYNEPRKVWVAGYYGIPSTRHTVWISEVEVPSSVPASTDVIQQSNGNFKEIEVFPNPVLENATVTFYLEKDAYCQFELYDLSGKKVALLNQDFVKKGYYRYQLQRGQIPAGFYLLHITSGIETLFTEKIVFK